MGTPLRRTRKYASLGGAPSALHLDLFEQPSWEQWHPVAKVKPMPVFHAFIVTSEDYVERRAPHRGAHLDRVMALRAKGVVVAGGPSPDGKIAELFYRVAQRVDAVRLIEEDPYRIAGAWTEYTLRGFVDFVDPLELPPLVTDGSRRVILAEGSPSERAAATEALLALRTAGRLGFGGLLEDGTTLALLVTADEAEARRWLAESRAWDEAHLSFRPYLYVL